MLLYPVLAWGLQVKKMTISNVFKEGPMEGQAAINARDDGIQPLFYKSLIIVDDDPTLCKIWERILKQVPCKSYKILSSPLEALEYAAYADADILLTDLKMPTMNGIQLIKEVQKINPQIKPIITTAYLQDTKSFSNLGAFIHIIKKPFKDLDCLKELLMLFLQNAGEVSNVELEEEDEGVYVWDL